MNLTKQAQSLIVNHISTLSKDKDKLIGVDATCGNGNDSVFLATHLKRVLCFDIQKQAIQNTHIFLQEAQLEQKSELIQRSHSFLFDEIQNRNLHKKIDVIMFNFGYLPKSKDLSITTQKSTSTTALLQAIDSISNYGVISLLCYRGHDGGEEEFNGLESVINGLDDHVWRVNYYHSAKPTKTTPLLIYLQKRNT
jgi:ribosomal protein S27AE